MGIWIWDDLGWFSFFSRLWGWETVIFQFAASTVNLPFPLLSAEQEAMNAHFMGCDAFENGDLLVTFPGCKEPL